MGVFFGRSYSYPPNFAPTMIQGLVYWINARMMRRDCVTGFKRQIVSSRKVSILEKKNLLQKSNFHHMRGGFIKNGIMAICIN